MSILFDLQNGKGFTEAEKSIAAYLLNHAEEIQDLSIGDLAAKTNTSNASIIRLCRKLGTKGYRDFRISFLREFERIPSDGKALDVSNPIYDRSSPSIVMKNIADVEKYAVNVCYTSVSALDLQKAAFLLSHAKRILIYGVGGILSRCQSFCKAYGPDRLLSDCH